MTNIPRILEDTVQNGKQRIDNESTHSFGRNSCRNPWIDVRGCRASSSERHDSNATGRQLLIRLILLMLRCVFIQSKSILNVHRFLVSDVMRLTRTLASDAVLSVKSERRRKAINKANKKLLRNAMHGTMVREHCASPRLGRFGQSLTMPTTKRHVRKVKSTNKVNY